jgi:hypothetical protein
MKLKPFDRFTNVLLILGVIGLCGLCSGIAWGILDARVFTWFANALTSGVLAAIITTAVALLVVFICLRILFVRKRDAIRETAPKAPGILVRQGENGAVFLSLPALEEIVLRNVRSNTKIRDCRCELLPVDAGVSVRIWASLAPDANIPEATAAVQDTVKTNVEMMCGIVVPEIQFVVERADAAANLPSNELKVRVQ